MGSTASRTRPRPWSGAPSVRATGPGFRAAVRASFANAALLAVVMTLAFAVLGGPRRAA